MTQPETLTYHYLDEHNIHEFIFAESSRLAMDRYFDFLYDIYDEHLKAKPIVRIILDIHISGMLPVKYATVIMEKTFKELAPFPKPYVAYLTGSSMDSSLIQGMDYTASKHVDRLHFPYEDRDKAIEWLLSKTTT